MAASNAVRSTSILVSQTAVVDVQVSSLRINCARVTDGCSRTAPVRLSEPYSLNAPSHMSSRVRREHQIQRASCLVALLCIISACSPPRHKNVGKYRVVEVSELFGICQPHQDIFFDGKRLATCGSPQAIASKQFPDPSCFTIAKDGRSAVYRHTPAFCGVGGDKDGGIYLHTADSGERLLYKDGEVPQSWGATSPDGIVMGFKCGELVVLAADGKVIQPRC